MTTTAKANKCDRTGMTAKTMAVGRLCKGLRCLYSGDMRSAGVYLGHKSFGALYALALAARDVGPQ